MTSQESWISDISMFPGSKEEEAEERGEEEEPKDGSKVGEDFWHPFPICRSFSFLTPSGRCGGVRLRLVVVPLWRGRLLI